MFRHRSIVSIQLIVSTLLIDKVSPISTSKTSRVNSELDGVLAGCKTTQLSFLSSTIPNHLTPSGNPVVQVHKVNHPGSDCSNFFLKKARQLGIPWIASTMESSRVISSETQAKLDNSKHVIRYQGISLSYLLEFWQKILSKSIAPDVELVVAKVKLADDVDKGRTMQIKSREQGQGGQTLKMHVPYRKNGELQQCSDDQITPKPREEWTIGDVCDFVVMDMVKEKKCFFTELDIVDPDKAVGHAFEGAFVSQARLCRFRDLLATLEAHYTNISAGQGIPERTFVWLDVFCANQPLVTDDSDEKLKKERCALLTEGLHIAIENFDERLFFFDSWVNPIPLGRAWCIWEIYGAVLSKKPLQLIFVPGETERFLEALIKDPENITKAISEMRPQAAKCFSEEDRNMIDEQVIQTVGWVEVKKTVVDQIMDWLIQTTEKAVESRTTEVSQENADLLRHAGVLMKNAGSFDLALYYCKRAYTMEREMYGDAPNKNTESTLNTMGTVYQAQGDYDDALDQYKKAYEIRKKVVDSKQSADIGEILNNMGTVYKAQEKYAMALDYFQRSLDHKKSAYSTQPNPSIGQTLNNMAGVYETLGEPLKALEYYKHALEIKTAVYRTAEHPSMGDTLNNMAGVYRTQGFYIESLEHYQKALNIYTAHYGNKHSRVGEALNNIGHVYSSRAKYAEALCHYQGSLRIKKAAYGSKNHMVVASTLNSLADVYLATGEYAKALGYYQSALDMKKAVFKTEVHPSVANTINNVGNVYQAQGKSKIACEYYHRALDIYDAFRTCKDHANAKIVRHNLANVFQDQGNYEEALETLSTALEAFRVSYRTDKQPDIAAIFATQSSILRCQGSWEQSLKSAQDSMKILDELHRGESHPDTAACLNNIAIFYQYQKDWDKSLEHFEKALKMLNDVFPDSVKHPSFAAVFNNKAIVLSNMAAVHPEKTYRQDALKLYGESLKIKKIAFAGLQNHPKIAASLNNMGKLYYSERDFVQALGFYQQSLSMFETIFGSKLHPHIAVVLSNMAELHRAEGREEVARELSQRSENILQTMYGENRPHMSPWIFDTIEIFL